MLPCLSDTIATLKFLNWVVFSKLVGAHSPSTYFRTKCSPKNVYLLEQVLRFYPVQAKSCSYLTGHVIPGWSYPEQRRGNEKGKARICSQMSTVIDFAHPNRRRWRGCPLQTLNANKKFFSFELQSKELRGRVFVMASDGGSQNREPISETNHIVSKKDEPFKEKAARIWDMKAGYVWLLGPTLSTAAIVLPPILFPLGDLFEKSYWVGLAATFGYDILFVLSTDLFFVISDKAGHHQQVPGGQPPWIGPWEYTGYPKGLPCLSKYILYAGAGIALLAALGSIILSKGSLALAAFGPYLVLILAQTVYEKILENDRVPVYPLVSIAYTVYRFRQLARSMEMIAIFDSLALFHVECQQSNVNRKFHWGCHDLAEDDQAFNATSGPTFSFKTDYHVKYYPRLRSSSSMMDIWRNPYVLEIRRRSHRLASLLSLSLFSVFGDSNLVVYALNGLALIKSVSLAPFVAEAYHLASSLPSISWSHISRLSKADGLANSSVGLVDGVLQLDLFSLDDSLCLVKRMEADDLLAHLVFSPICSATRVPCS
eukprot:Gb_29531 [translate_table: standard]